MTRPAVPGDGQRCATGSCGHERREHEPECWICGQRGIECDRFREPAPDGEMGERPLCSCWPHPQGEWQFKVGYTHQRNCRLHPFYEDRPAAPVVRAEDAAGELREQDYLLVFTGRDVHATEVDRRWLSNEVEDVLALPALRELAAAAERPAIDVAHLARQREWSRQTFGPGPRTKGVCDHIRKELAEIEAEPADLGEWVDVIILAFDGAWRSGHEPHEIIAAVKAKQARNQARTWPDWRTADPDKAIEHVRTGCGCGHDWVHGICRAHGEARRADGRCGCLRRA